MKNISNIQALYTVLLITVLVTTYTIAEAFAVRFCASPATKDLKTGVLVNYRTKGFLGIGEQDKDWVLGNDYWFGELTHKGPYELTIGYFDNLRLIKQDIIAQNSHKAPPVRPQRVTAVTGDDVKYVRGNLLGTVTITIGDRDSILLREECTESPLTCKLVAYRLPANIDIGKGFSCSQVTSESKPGELLGQSPEVHEPA